MKFSSHRYKIQDRSENADTNVRNMAVHGHT